MAQTIGSNIAEVRTVLGFTQTSLARKTGLSQAAVSSIEQGTRGPSVATLIKIKRALGCEWAALLRGLE